MSAPHNVTTPLYIEPLIDRIAGQEVVERSRRLASIPGSLSVKELPALIRDPRRWLHDRFENYGRVFKTRLMVPGVFMIGADANKTIMLTRRDEFSYGGGYAQTNVKVIFAGSIMLQDGEEHAKTRRMLTPAVGRLAVRESGDAVAGIWGAALERGSRLENVDCYEFARSTTFRVAANVLTGLELGEEARQFDPLMETIIQGMMAPLPVRIPGASIDKAIRAREKVIELLKPRILRARREPAKGLVGQMAHHQEPDGSYLSAEEIAHHLILLFWAGYDTTASSSTWILHRLAQRPDWQRRLREELQHVEKLGVDELEAGRKFPVVEAFLHEIERHTPSVLFFPRVAIDDIEYQGFTIPGGTPVFYSPYMSHHDPGTWSHPEAFDPDRFLDKERGERSANLVGFGGGPRICLGKAFARLQLKLMLHDLVMNYEVAPDARIPWTVRALPVHHPVNSHIRIRKRR